MLKPLGQGLLVIPTFISLLLEKAIQDTRAIEISKIREKINKYCNDCSNYPPDSNWCMLLLNKVNDTVSDAFLKKLLVIWVELVECFRGQEYWLSNLPIPLCLQAGIW